MLNAQIEASAKSNRTFQPSARNFESNRICESRISESNRISKTPETTRFPEPLHVETAVRAGVNVSLFLPSEEIRDLFKFGFRKNHKKVVVLSHDTGQISVSQVRHGHYFRDEDLELYNGDYISKHLRRYNSHSRQNDTVSLFQWNDQRQHEYDKQCQRVRLDHWLESKPRPEDLVACAEMVSLLTRRPGTPHDWLSVALATLEIRNSLFRLSLVELCDLVDCVVP
jgi:hypothetical protein